MLDVQIRCFLETARTGSILVAADNLYFSAQTVGNRVYGLEAELGVKLFDRTAKKLRLTEAGNYYYSLFRTSEYHYERVVSEINDYYEKSRKIIKIGCSEWVNPFGELLELFEGYKWENKDITLDLSVLDNEELFSSLDSGGIDFALQSSGHIMSDKGMDIIPICPQEICLWGPEDIIGDDLPEEQKQKREELSFLLIHGWNKSYAETKLAYDKDAVKSGLSMTNAFEVYNVQSMYHLIKSMKFTSFQDRRFGYFNGIPGLGYEVLSKDVNLCACVAYQNEKEIVYKFIEYMKKNLCNDV